MDAVLMAICKRTNDGYAYPECRGLVKPCTDCHDLGCKGTDDTGQGAFFRPSKDEIEMKIAEDWKSYRDDLLSRFDSLSNWIISEMERLNCGGAAKK
ncbi:MAG: hypothetical protein V1879_08265 [Pseudomonadota bacterium]